MRFSAATIFAVVAIGAQALPQDVQPITQISDGQIQAPPATASASYEVPSATEVVPTVTPSAAESSAYNTPVAPSVPVGTGASSAPYPISSSGAVYTNGTVVPTGGASSTSAPAGESSTGSPQPTESVGSAATTFVSMGAMVAGLFAFLA